MSLANELGHRIAYLFRRGRFERELEDELRFHMETRADELEWSGLDREQALARARREFGSGARAREETREAWQIGWLEDGLRDVRYACRALRRSPGFAAAAILSLALGIGANTTVFSLVKALLLGDASLRDADRLASFHQASGAARLSYPDFQDYRRQVPAFEDVAASYPSVARSLGGENPERLWGQLVTTNYFLVLGAQPQLGRGFTADENVSHVVVISDALWRRKFGGDASIIGRTIQLGEKAYTLVGVAPPRFHGNLRGLETDFWIPLGLYHETISQLGQGARGPLEQDRNYPWLYATARLKAGTPRAVAQAALEVAETRLDRLYPRANEKRSLRLEAADALPLGFSQAKALLGTLMAVVGLVLLVACANVANLLLARSAARRREMGARLAIGAGRARLVRQLLAESLLLSAVGAVFGVALAWAAIGAIGKLQTALPYPVALDLAIDSRVLLFTAAVAVLTGVLFGLAPAIKASRLDFNAMLKDGGAIAGPRGFGLKNGLVAAQIAASLVLLVAAGLFIRSLQFTSAVPLGMNAQNVTLLHFDPRAAGYGNEHAERLFADVLDRVRALPNVQSAALADTMPLSFTPGAAGVSRPGREIHLVADIYGVTPQYFRTLGIALDRGADFATGRPTTMPPPAIINEALAGALFGGADPVGSLVAWEGIPHHVVGVARDVKSRSATENARPQIYVPLELEYPFFLGLSGVALAVRSPAPPAAVVGSVRGAMRSLDPAMPVYQVERMTDHVGRALLVPRLCGALFGVFGAVGLALAAVGLYGVMSYAARQRTREIGVRMALGASARDVVGMLALSALRVTGIGLAIGLALALAASRAAAAFLYGVKPGDALTFGGVSLLLFAVAMAAALIPAWRAAGVDALRAIRHE